MPELRYNVICHEWVVIAHERARRPSEFSQSNEAGADLVRYDPTCPFCPDTEGADEVCHMQLPAVGQWQGRIVPNKFPALSQHSPHGKRDVGFQRSIGGYGVHDVVVEHRRHDLCLPLMTEEEVARVVSLCAARSKELRQDHRLQAIVVFKNHGPAAGTSLVHPHSQIVATPIVPNRTRSRLEEAQHFFDATGQCLFCKTVDDELSDGRRIVAENEHFVALVPYAALSPFHLWIFPRRHEASFDEITPAETSSLGTLLKSVIARLYYGLGDPSYNYTILSLPLHEKNRTYFHWYVSVVPRVSKIAGFELGSGMYINTSIPEESAAFLRDVIIPTA